VLFDHQTFIILETILLLSDQNGNNLIVLKLLLCKTFKTKVIVSLK